MMSATGALVGLLLSGLLQSLTLDMVSLVIRGTTLVLYLFRELLL